MNETPEKLGAYEVGTELGRGAGSTIYLVRDPKTKKQYALKRVLLDGQDDKKFLQQLDAEWACSQGVGHEAIRRCLDYKKIRTLLRVSEAHLIMEYIDGSSLAEWQPKGMADKVQIFLGVAEGLAALKHAGFVHADIKPNNILVDKECRVRLIDLGQSCPEGTIKERIQGTPDYIAPEQVKRRALTAQTDMFNLGASMYWCLTGKKVPTLIPETDEHGNPLPRKRRGFPRPMKLNPHIPPMLDKLIGDLVRTNPAKRPESWGVVISRMKIIHLQLTQDHGKDVPEITIPSHGRQSRVAG